MTLTVNFFVIYMYMLFYNSLQK